MSNEIGTNSKNSRRELTQEERSLTRWLLENADPRVCQDYFSQLDRARVSGMCPCGCASFDLEVEGMPEPTGGIHVLGDFLFGDAETLCGVFVFERGGVLAGVEVTGYAVDAPRSLPSPAELRPFE